MRKPALILAVLAAAVFAAMVLAPIMSSTHATTNPITLARRLAERYWRATPCGGRVRVTSSATLPTKVADLAINERLSDGKALLFAWTTFDTPDGPNQIHASPSVYTDCTITLNATLWRSWQIDDANFQWLCDVITHELGHLFGQADEGQTDPASINYPFLEPGSPNYGAVPECRHVTLWYGGRKIRR